MKVQQVLNKAFGKVLESPEFGTADLANWEKWTRTNLGNLLEILPYDNPDFDLAVYMQDMTTKVADKLYPDDENEKEQFFLDVSRAFEYLPERSSPTADNVANYMAERGEANEKVSSLFLIYAYHLRRTHHRIDETKGPELTPVGLPDTTATPPEPVLPDPLLTIELEEENQRERKRFAFMQNLRVFATHRINWSYGERKEALVSLERGWKQLDKYSQMDLEFLYNQFKHDCGPI